MNTLYSFLFRLGAVLLCIFWSTTTFAAGADDFVIKVQTNQVTSTDTTFTLPLNPSENYNFTVDWGDGQTEIITTNVSPTHTYANPGQYTIRITENVAGGFPQVYFNNDGKTSTVDTNAKKLRFIEQWGTIQWKSMQNAFFGTPNMKLNASDAPDLSRVTSMINMFRNGTSFEDLQDKIGTWNTSNVKHMRYTFFANSIFNEDISAWNTNNLESMNNMFDSALKFNQNLNNWNTSKVIQMYEMFHNAKDFNQPLSNWDVSKVTDMRYVFAGAEKFNQPLDTWNVGKVTDMKAMFNGAHAFNQDISMWDTSKVTNMWWMFEDTRTFNQDISSWNVEKVTDMTKMFALARAFNQDLGAWNPVALTTAIEFYSAETPVSRENYDGLLKGWAEKNLVNSVPFGAIGKKYCLGENARNNTLIAAKNWTITDGGKDCTGVDITPPVITFVTDIPNATQTGHIINITIVDADNNGIPATYKYGFSDTNTCDTSVHYTEVLTPGQNITLSDVSKNGKYICVVASDTNGNTAYQASAYPINLDQTPPVINITDNITAGFTQSETIKATVTDNTANPAPILSYLLTSNTTCDASLPAASFTQYGGDIVVDDETKNEKYVCFRAVDAAGNVSYARTDHPIQVDVTPPQTQPSTPTSGPGGGGGSTGSPTINPAPNTPHITPSIITPNIITPYTPPITPDEILNSQKDTVSLTTETTPSGQKVFTLNKRITNYICPKIVQAHTYPHLLTKDNPHASLFHEDIAALAMFRGMEKDEMNLGQTYEEYKKHGVVLNTPYFEPQRNVTRAEFVKMLVRSLSCRYTYMGTNTPFSDVDTNQWYAEYIKFATENKWINGYHDGTFRPNNPITREEAAKILSRAIQLDITNTENNTNNTNHTNTTTSSFSDINPHSEFLPYIETLKHHGIMKGRTNTTFAPTEYIPRTETSRIIYRTFFGGVR